MKKHYECPKCGLNFSSLPPTGHNPFCPNCITKVTDKDIKKPLRMATPHGGCDCWACKQVKEYNEKNGY